MAQETPDRSAAPRPPYRPREGGSGDRDRDRDRGGGRSFGGPPGMRRPRRKVCTFCVDKVQRIDYKDVGRIRRYISDRGKIDPRRKSGTCAKHQRMLTAALKRARHMALLPYTAEHVRSLMSPQARAMAGGPPPPKPERPPYRPGGYGAPGGFRPAGAPPAQQAASAPSPQAAPPQPAATQPPAPQPAAAPAPKAERPA